MTPDDSEGAVVMIVAEVVGRGLSSVEASVAEGSLGTVEVSVGSETEGAAVGASVGLETVG